jgi:hypothetical protein
VLFRHAPDHYRAMLRAATDDAALAEMERAGFGVSHDALGAALCESWGLGAAAVHSVRHHVAAQSLRSIRSPQAQRSTLDGMRWPVMGRPACEVEVMARA